MPGQMKGAPMREILRWHERNVGRARVRAIGAALPPELAPHVDLEAEALGLIPSAWYPTTVGNALLDGVFTGLDGAARHAAMRDADHAALRATARGVYRLVLARLVTPSFMASSIQRLWRMIFDDGEREMVLTSDTSIRSRTWAWGGHGPGPLLCELMSENTAAVLETMGKREVKVDRISCVSRGGSECETHYRWSDRLTIRPPV